MSENEHMASARDVIAKTISDMAENSVYTDLPAGLYADEIMDVLESSGYTIVPEKTVCLSIEDGREIQKVLLQSPSRNWRALQALHGALLPIDLDAV